MTAPVGELTSSSMDTGFVATLGIFIRDSEVVFLETSMVYRARSWLTNCSVRVDSPVVGDTKAAAVTAALGKFTIMRRGRDVVVEEASEDEEWDRGVPGAWREMRLVLTWDIWWEVQRWRGKEGKKGKGKV